VLRRRSAQAAEDQAASPPSDETAEATATAARPGVNPGKGRPTPKRSEAEKRRRAPYSAPADRKAAAAQGRTEARQDRTRRAEALRRGEEWALPAKDRGHVRALARDVVESRRRPSEYFLYVVGLLFLLVITGVAKSVNPGIVDVVALGIVLIAVGEGSLVARQVARMARDRFPGESTRRLATYTILRATQPRPLRMPKPRVRPGSTV
jgi:Protein of unknown function (DUF3043)